MGTATPLEKKRSTNNQTHRQHAGPTKAKDHVPLSLAIFQEHLGSVRQHYHTAKLKLTASVIDTPPKFWFKKVDVHSLKLTVRP